MKTIIKNEWSTLLLIIFFIFFGEIGFSQTSNDDLIVTLIETIDTDYDGVNDDEDEDIDNDGITNIQEDLNLDFDYDYSTNPTDSDEDGIPNYKDLDSDNDGISDLVEAGGLDEDGDGRVPVNENGTLTFDFENDGLTDEFIVDTNQDGEADQAVDLLLAGAEEIPLHDTDKDGLPNTIDIDSDSDGITDVIENGGVDLNHDGRVDYEISGDPTSLADVDEDGFTDLNDSNDNTSIGIDDGSTISIIKNTDSDLYPNYIDIDSDGDGIVDNIEYLSTFEYIPATELDEDNDGLDNAYDKDQSNDLSPVDTDADGIPDYLDEDSDNDEFLDLEEGWDTDNDGYANTAPFNIDTDEDGLDNAFDTQNNFNDAIPYSINASNDMTPLDFPDLDNPENDRDWREVFNLIEEFNVLDGFSPNGDNINEVLLIIGIEKFPEHEVTIYNRWGNVVWKTTDYSNNPWDGTSMFGLTLGGSILPAGTYFYQLDLSEDTSTIDEKELQGYIYLNK